MPSESQPAQSERDSRVLDALAAACAAEVGGWATPLPVTERLGVGPSGLSGTLLRLVREGRVEVWKPRAGTNRITNLYRPTGR